MRRATDTDRVKHPRSVLAVTIAVSLSAISSTSFAAAAPTASHLSGVVTYSDKTPLPGIYLELADAADPATPIGAAYTDRDGHFDLQTNNKSWFASRTTR